VVVGDQYADLVVRLGLNGGFRPASLH
jgi:hypothetical protein